MCTINTKNVFVVLQEKEQEERKKELQREEKEREAEEERCAVGIFGICRNIWYTRDTKNIKDFRDVLDIWDITCMWDSRDMTYFLPLKAY